MHSNKIALTLVMGIMVSNVWAEPNSTATNTEVTTTVPADSNTTPPQVEVKVEDIDAPILE